MFSEVGGSLLNIEKVITRKWYHSVKFGVWREQSGMVFPGVREIRQNDHKMVFRKFWFEVVSISSFFVDILFSDILDFNVGASMFHTYYVHGRYLHWPAFLLRCIAYL